MTIESFVIFLCMAFLAIFTVIGIYFVIELCRTLKYATMRENDWTLHKTSIYIEAEGARQEVLNKIKHIEEVRSTPEAAALRRKLYGKSTRGDKET